jgi:hypothetical protein
MITTYLADIVGTLQSDRLVDDLLTADAHEHFFQLLHKPLKNINDKYL